jgi:hypothetical protein
MERKHVCILPTGTNDASAVIFRQTFLSFFCSLALRKKQAERQTMQALRVHFKLVLRHDLVPRHPLHEIPPLRFPSLLRHLPGRLFLKRGGMDQGRHVDWQQAVSKGSGRRGGGGRRRSGVQRISVAWCKQFDVPLNKVLTKTLLEKFTWATHVEERTTQGGS